MLLRNKFVLYESLEVLRDKHLCVLYKYKDCGYKGLFEDDSFVKWVGEYLREALYMFKKSFKFNGLELIKHVGYMSSSGKVSYEDGYSDVRGVVVKLEFEGCVAAYSPRYNIEFFVSGEEIKTDEVKKVPLHTYFTYPFKKIGVKKGDINNLEIEGSGRVCLKLGRSFNDSNRFARQKPSAYSYIVLFDESCESVDYVVGVLYMLEMLVLDLYDQYWDNIVDRSFEGFYNSIDKSFNDFLDSLVGKRVAVGKLPKGHKIYGESDYIYKEGRWCKKGGGVGKDNPFEFLDSMNLVSPAYKPKVKQLAIKKEIRELPYKDELPDYIQANLELLYGEEKEKVQFNPRSESRFKDQRFTEDVEEYVYSDLNDSEIDLYARKLDKLKTEVYRQIKAFSYSVGYKPSMDRGGGDNFKVMLNDCKGRLKLIEDACCYDAVKFVDRYLVILSSVESKWSKYDKLHKRIKEFIKCVYGVFGYNDFYVESEKNFSGRFEGCQIRCNNNEGRLIFVLDLGAFDRGKGKYVEDSVEFMIYSREGKEFIVCEDFHSRAFSGMLVVVYEVILKVLERGFGEIRLE